MDFHKLVSTLLVCLPLVISGSANIGATDQKQAILAETKQLSSIKDYNTLRMHVLNEVTETVSYWRLPKYPTC